MIDKDLHKYFKLTDKEIDLIENTIIQCHERCKRKLFRFTVPKITTQHLNIKKRTKVSIQHKM